MLLRSHVVSAGFDVCGPGFLSLSFSFSVSGCMPRPVVPFSPLLGNRSIESSAESLPCSTSGVRDRLDLGDEKLLELESGFHPGMCWLSRVAWASWFGEVHVVLVHPGIDFAGTTI